MLSTKEIQENVKKVALKYPVKNVKLFGSYAEGNANENSDVDLLVEFFKPHVSLFVLSGLRMDIEELLGKDVDLIHAPVPKDSLLDIGRTISIYEA